jgi:hypothetical protein
LLRLFRIEPAQDRVLSLGTGLISLFDINQAQVEVRENVIIL